VVFCCLLEMKRLWCDDEEKASWNEGKMMHYIENQTPHENAIRKETVGKEKVYIRR